jgi:hypothetical protein
MATIPNVVGPSWPARSRNQNLERSINLYPEGNDGGGSGKNASGALYGTAGLIPGWALSAGPIRGLFAQDGRVWGVGGAFVCELFASGEVVPYPLDIGVDDNPVTFSSNGTAGNQVMVTAGGLIYIIDLTTNVMTHVSSVNFLTPALMGVFLDDYFIVMKGGSRQMYLSALLDGTSWDPLDVFEVSKFSDNLVAIGVSHEILWAFGSKHSLPYEDTGDLNIPFQPIPQSLVEHGVLSPFSLVQADNTLLYQAQDALGVRQVVKMNGYTPQIISNPGIQTYMETVPPTDNVIGWTWQESGHLNYQMLFENLPTSPVYDIATSQWHERALWDPTIRDWKPHIGRCHCYGFGKHLVGSRSSNTVYVQSLDQYQDLLISA